LFVCLLFEASKFNPSAYSQIHPPEYFLHQYEVDAVHYDDQLEATLTGLGLQVVHLMHGVNTDSGNNFESMLFVCLLVCFVFFVFLFFALHFISVLLFSYVGGI
jgi:hypothetical protein